MVYQLFIRPWLDKIRPKYTYWKFRHGPVSLTTLDTAREPGYHGGQIVQASEIPRRDERGTTVYGARSRPGSSSTGRIPGSRGTENPSVGLSRPHGSTDQVWKLTAA